ncbi:MAG: PAS domain S-box protein [Prolixibacteraceae bacterium]|nr:PAS domain S-box protein [Prolixibacteraceae bacterium]
MKEKTKIREKGVEYKHNSFKYLLAVLIIVICIILSFTGYYYFEHEKKITQKDRYNELHAIALLKANQLTQWKNERLSEASFFTDNQPYIQYALNNIHGKHDEDSLLRKSLLHIMTGNRYENIFMLNKNGQVTFSVQPQFNLVDTASVRFSEKVFNSGKIIFRDFYYCNTHKNIRLTIIAPIFENGQVAATMFFLINPDDFLYPLIMEWPAPNHTGETYIIRQRGDSIQYLSPLKFSAVPLLHYFSHILNPGSIAPILFTKHEGIIECTDYRGESVLASISEVQGTPWNIISKIDKKEAFSELNTTLIFLLILLFLAVLLFISFALLFYHYKQRNIYRELFIEKELLYQAREEFKATFYSMGDGVITTTREGNISQINPIAEILTGWIEQEAKGELLENVFCIIDEQSLEKEKEIVKKILKGSEYAVISQQKTLVSKNGSEIPVIFSATPVKDQKGNILGAVIVFSDQREQREKEKALIESEKSYKELIDGMNETVWIIDFNGTLIDTNRTATEMLGYSKEELIEIGLYGIDTSLKKEMIQGLAKTMPVDQIQIFETTHRKKSGETFPVEVYSSLINYHGEKAILSIARDITNRKKAEHRISEERIRLRTLIDNLPDAIYIKDKDGRKLAANAADLKMMNCSSEKEILGKTDIEIYGTAIGENGYNEDMQVINSGKPMLNKENSYIDNDGQKHWRTISKIPLFDEKGIITGLVGFGRDITQRMQMINDLMRAKEKAEESDRLKSAFLANISHEIRTPMNGILGFLELLQEPDLSDEQKEIYLDIMDQSGQRLLETINGIVEISKIESKQIDLNYSYADVSKVMKYHYDFFKQRAAKKGLLLKLNIEPAYEKAQIHTDKNKLDGIITNLLSNAIKYTKEGEIEFGIYSENRSAVFYVKDSGIGIPKNRIASMFERFTQANTSYTRTQEGSGLGLAIVKAYVEALGGKVWVKSEVGKGSTFYFSIPQKNKS